MTDAEGIRNLVGTGLVQLVSSVVTALIALCVLFVLNWRMTSITLIALAIFGACMSLAFNRLRPLFRERGKINAELRGDLVKHWAASASSKPIPQRSVKRSFLRVARIVCSATSPVR